MRVLHVVPSLDRDGGGPTSSVIGLCAAEARAGADVTLLSFGTGHVDVPEGVHATVVNPLRGTRQGLTPVFLKGLSAATKTAQVVHIHSLWNPPTSVAQRFARSRGIPYVISPHGMLQEVSLARRTMLKRFVAKFGERSNISHAAGMHFLTEEERASSATFGDLPERVLVLPNGIEPGLSGSVPAGRFRKLHRDLEGKRIVLFVGRLHWSKGLTTQLDAMTELVGGGKELVWVLIGPDEGEWPGLLGEAARRGLASDVLWLGSQPRAACLEAIRDCDVLWLTSRHEAHSMVLNEALALGAALVITDSVGFSSLGDRGAALVVPRAASAVAAATGRILDEPGLAPRLAEQGTRFATDELGWPRIANSMLQFYEDASGSGRRPGAG